MKKILILLCMVGLFATKSFGYTWTIYSVSLGPNQPNRTVNQSVTNANYATKIGYEYAGNAGTTVYSGSTVVVNSYHTPEHQWIWKDLGRTYSSFGTIVFTGNDNMGMVSLIIQGYY